MPYIMVPDGEPIQHLYVNEYEIKPTQGYVNILFPDLKQIFVEDAWINSVSSYTFEFVYMGSIIKIKHSLSEVWASSGEKELAYAKLAIGVTSKLLSMMRDSKLLTHQQAKSAGAPLKDHYFHAIRDIFEPPKIFSQGGHVQWASTYPTTGISVSQQSEELPGMHTAVPTACNCDEYVGVKADMWEYIQHLNDNHTWTREKIADWLDDLHDRGLVDIEFKEPIESKKKPVGQGQATVQAKVDDKWQTVGYTSVEVDYSKFSISDLKDEIDKTKASLKKFAAESKHFDKEIKKLEEALAKAQKEIKGNQ